jgi:hypothetical protein
MLLDSNFSYDLVDYTFNNELKNKLIRNRKGENIGKIVGNIHNIGLAITSALKIGKFNLFYFIHEENDQETMGYIDETPCTLIKTDWYMERISGYIKRIKERDANIDLSDVGN